MSIWTNKLCGWCEKSMICIFIDLNLSERNEQLTNNQWMCFTCVKKVILDAFLEKGVKKLLTVIKNEPLKKECNNCAVTKKFCDCVSVA